MIEVATVELHAAGVACGEILREPWGSLCEVLDPDGYEIGLFSS
jgi:hypothetical protein